MKIASQLLSTTLETATKTVTSLDQAPQFQGLLVATAAKGSSVNDISHLKGRPQSQDVKSLTSQIKKKSADSDLTETPVTSLDTTAPRPMPANASNQFVGSFPLTPAAPTQSSDPIATDSHLGSASYLEQSLLASSSASASVLVQRPTDSPTTAWTDQKATDGLSAETALSEATPVYGANSSNFEPLTKQVVEAQPLTSQRDTPSVATMGVPMGAVSNVTNTPKMKVAVDAVVPVTAVLPPIVGDAVSPVLVANAKAEPMPVIPAPSITETRTTSAPTVSIPSGVHTTPVAVAKPYPGFSVESPTRVAEPSTAAAPGTTAQPTPRSLTPKAAVDGQLASIAKADYASDAMAAVQVVDSASSATQQTVAVDDQSAAAAVSVSLPGLAVEAESQIPPAIAANQEPLAGRLADTIDSLATHQSGFAVRVKPASGASARSSKLADDSDTGKEDMSTSAATAFSVPKMAEGSGTVNQASNDSRNALHTGNVQQAIPAETAYHPSQSPLGGSASAQTTASSVPAQALPEGQPMQGVSSAQLIQSMRSSEMKLGMQSVEFGSISISTSLNHQALSAQISLDHSELGRALAVHLPAIEEKLGSAYGVQAKVELRDSSNPSSNDSGYSNSGQQSREQRQSQSGGPAAISGAMLERIAARASFTPVSTTVAASRLDIRI